MATNNLKSNVTINKISGVNQEKQENKTDLHKRNDLEEKIDFERALQLAGSGRYCYIIQILSIFTLLAAGAEIFSIGIIVTASQCDLELDVNKKELIGAVPVLGVIISAHFWGYLADTKGRKYTLIISITGTIITAVISSFSTDWIFMAVTKFFSAVCASGSNALIYALLGESTPQTIRSRALLVATTGLMFLQAINVSLAYPILSLSFSYYIPFLEIYYRPWRLLVQVIALASVLNLLLLILCTYESPKFYFSQDNHDKGLKILQKIYEINTGCSTQNFPVKRVVLDEDLQTFKKKRNIFQSMWDQTVPLLSRKYIKNTLLICYISMVTYSIGPPLAIWLPEIFNSYTRSQTESSDFKFCEMFHRRISEQDNDTMVMMEPICNDEVSNFTFVALVGFATHLTISSTITVVIIKYIGKKWTFIGIYLLSAVFAFITTIVNNIWGIISLVIMLTNAVSMSITTAYAVELFPTYMRAMTVCLTIMVGRTASFFILNVIGTQLLTNCVNFLYSLGGFILSGALVGLFLPSDHKTKNNGDIETNATETYKATSSVQK